MRAEEFDVVVVGAGLAGGLPAAAYLQRAGATVALVERGAACAPFSASYERGPGVRFDVAPVNFSCVSPALADLDLGAHGYRVDFPAILWSTVDGAGRVVTYFADPVRTAESLARFSARDAGTFGRLLSRLSEHARAILTAAMFTSEPDLAAALDLTADAAELSAAELARLTAPQLVERLFESDAVRISATALPAINLFGDLLEPGQGALAWLWTFLLRSCRAPAGASALPAALERAFVAHGGTLLTHAEAVRIQCAPDGRCSGVDVRIGEEAAHIRARHAVISNLGADLTSELLGQELRAGWRSAGRVVFVADVVLARPLAWASEELRRSPRVYLLWESWDACVAWLHAARLEREEAFVGHLELTQFDVLYGAGAGGTPLRVRFGTGPFVDDAWDDRRATYDGPLRRRIVELDPGARIEDVHFVTPLDLWRLNPAARHGNPVGGDFVPGQWLGERLEYRTSIPGLFLSNSVWPTALSWMAPGYNAASVVAEDLGLRDRPWWVHPPLPDLAGVSEGASTSPR